MIINIDPQEACTFDLFGAGSYAKITYNENVKAFNAMSNSL